MFTSGTGTPNGVFSVSAGSLPPGLALSAAGVLAGTPTVAGSYTFTVTAQNLIGSAGAQFTIVVDFTAPTAAPTAAPAPNAAGWSNQDVTVQWNWVDEPGGAGIDAGECTNSSTSAGQGAAIELGASCTDLAGNTRNATHTVKVDKTAPTVTCATAPTFVLGGSFTTDVTASVTDGLSGALAALVAEDVPAADVAGAGTKSKNLTGTDRAGNMTTQNCPYVVVAPAASELTLQTRRIVVIKRNTRSIAVTCTLDQPALDTCSLTLRAARRTLATAEARAAAQSASTTLTLPLSRRVRKRARRPGGLAATLAAHATQTRGGALQASIPLQLLPKAVVSAPSDGMFKTGSTKLPRNGTAYLRRLRELVSGARRLRCIGHTDSVGSSASNHKLGLARARAVCAFLTNNTSIARTVRSQGETNPRASNATPKDARATAT